MAGGTWITSGCASTPSLRQVFRTQLSIDVHGGLCPLCCRDNNIMRVFGGITGHKDARTTCPLITPHTHGSLRGNSTSRGMRKLRSLHVACVEKQSSTGDGRPVFENNTLKLAERSFQPPYF